jgi:hypothetical protein
MNNNRNPVLTITDLGLTISVWFDRYDSFGTVDHPRSQYAYRIVDATHRDGDPIYAEGTDLRAPGDPDLIDALRTLLNFWSAAQESYDHNPKGENADLFPAALLDIGISSDEIAYTASWLGGDR